MDVEALVSQYLLCLKAEGKTAATLRWHQASLRQFVAWMRTNQHPDDPARWSPSLLRAYVAFQQERPTATGSPLSASGLNSLIRSLRAFCSWLRNDGWVDHDPFAKVAVPEAPKLVQATLSADEVRRLLATVRSRSRNRLRDEALILFLLDTGCRANELCTLSATGFDWEHRVARVFGKGAKERYVPFSVSTARALQRYALRERKGHSERFFESEEGDPLTPSGLYQLCKRVGKVAGVPVHPHKFRHTFATTALRSGASVFVVQKMLGHATLDMTLRYSNLLTDDIVAAHREHSPVENLFRSRRSRTR